MSNATKTSTRIDITPLAGEIGAVISGVAAAAPPDDQTIAEYARALLAHRVVFLHDQQLDYDRPGGVRERLGPLTLGHPTLPPVARLQPFLEEIDSSKAAPANRWHTDVTFCDRPPGLHAPSRRADARRGR